MAYVMRIYLRKCGSANFESGSKCGKIRYNSDLTKNFEDVKVINFCQDTNVKKCVTTMI